MEERDSYSAGNTRKGNRPNRGEPKPMNAAEKSIIVNAPVAEVYERWLRFEELPKFIPSLGQVERIDDTHFSFCNLRDGKEQRGVIEVIRQIPERRIAWRALTEGWGWASSPSSPVPITPLKSR